jgi:DMSO/TMAO reductase YedYZ heme-binding membrane subunit
MNDVIKKWGWGYRLLLAALIAFVIQLPFLVLMNFVGIHSTLGAVWVIFYLPAILLFDKIGLKTTSSFTTVVKAAAIQEILLASIILCVMLMFKRKKQTKKSAAE